MPSKKDAADAPSPSKTPRKTASPLPPPSLPKPQKPPVTPRHAVRQTPLAAFVANEANQDVLRSIIANPVFLAACHHIAQRLAPTEAEIVCLADAPLRAKTAAHRVALSFPEEIEALLRPQHIHTEPTPWAHIAPDPR